MRGIVELNEEPEAGAPEEGGVSEPVVESLPQYVNPPKDTGLRPVVMLIVVIVLAICTSVLAVRLIILAKPADRATARQAPVSAPAEGVAATASDSPSHGKGSCWHYSYLEPNAAPQPVSCSDPKALYIVTSEIVDTSECPIGTPFILNEPPHLWCVSSTTKRVVVPSSR